MTILLTIDLFPHEYNEQHNELVKRIGRRLRPLRHIKRSIKLSPRNDSRRQRGDYTRTRIISPIDEGSAFLRDDILLASGENINAAALFRVRAAPRAHICRRGAQWEEPSKAHGEDCFYAKFYVTRIYARIYAPFDAPVRCLHRTYAQWRSIWRTHAYARPSL